MSTKSRDTGLVMHLPDVKRTRLNSLRVSLLISILPTRFYYCPSQHSVLAKRLSSSTKQPYRRDALWEERIPTLNLQHFAPNFSKSAHIWHVRIVWVSVASMLHLWLLVMKPHKSILYGAIGMFLTPQRSGAVPKTGLTTCLPWIIKLGLSLFVWRVTMMLKGLMWSWGVNWKGPDLNRSNEWFIFSLGEKWVTCSTRN